MIARAYSYTLEHEALGDPVPTVAGLAVTLGVTREQVYTWRKKRPEFDEACKFLMATQERKLMAGGVTGEFKPVITKLLLMSNHGHHERKQVDHTGTHKPLTLADLYREDAPEAEPGPS